jgi:S-adenosylmethionine:tRNA ribosyltransferase-isomerase
MRRSDFEFTLPEELIAQTPLAQRSASRLLVLDPAGLADARIDQLPALLRGDDLLVFNDTRVLPARLAARRATGGRVEIFLERALAGCGALVHARASNVLRAGETLASAGGPVLLERPQDDLWEVQLPVPAVEFFERHGAVPLPPYITRTPDEADRERYQSLLARVPGAVAAPTASLHFDAELLAALAARGVRRATLTLHVGAGTFQPVREENLDQHVMHAERYEIGSELIEALQRARRDGGRVIAVGTTVTRALESAVDEATPAEDSASRSSSGRSSSARSSALRSGPAETRLFIRPGFRFRVIDGLITNFHLPGSTLLMLVAAYAGHERVLQAYAHAVQQRYRFFSYGDAMLVWPAPGALS